MFKKTAKKIAIALNLFLLLQLASMGLGAQAASAHQSEEPIIPSVTKLELVSTGFVSDVIGDLTDNAVFNLTELDTNQLSVLATTDPKNLGDGSVRFVLDGTARNENVYPYYLNGDQRIWKYYFVLPSSGLTVGEHVLSVTPYTGQNGEGTEGVGKTVHFSIIDNPVASVPYANDYTITDQTVSNTPAITIPVTYNEIMNKNIAPTVTIDPAAASTISVDTVNSKWSSQNSFWPTRTYDLVINLSDANVELSSASFTITGATDWRGHIQVPYTYPGQITIDTKNPIPAIDPVVTNKAMPEITGTVDDSAATTAIHLTGAGVDLELPAVVDPATGKWKVNVTQALIEGVYDVSATATDLNGNVGVVAGKVTVDLTAPTKIINLAGVLNSSGQVVLNWTNPTEGYNTLKVVRVSDGNTVVTELPDTLTTTFTDSTVEKGKSYSYTVVAADLAGNETVSNEATVAVPAPVVATPAPPANQIASGAISDSGAAISTDNNKEEKAQDVKAEEAKDDNKKEEGLPFWGLMLLIILAGVGAYLFYAQRPQPVVVPPVKKKRNNPPKKNTRPRTSKK